MVRSKGILKIFSRSPILPSARAHLPSSLPPSSAPSDFAEPAVDAGIYPQEKHLFPFRILFSLDKEKQLIGTFFFSYKNNFL